MANHTKNFARAGNVHGYAVQPLTDIYLHSDFKYNVLSHGDITYIYMFSMVGVFILFIAYINFINLTTARASERAKEIGVRKVLGQLKVQLTSQFLLESLIISLSALIFASVLSYAILPTFNQVVDKSFTDPLFNGHHIWLIMLSVTVCIGIIAGFYPAFVMSRYSPGKALRAEKTEKRDKSLFRNALVVFQFAISVMLIIGTLITYQQLDFIQNKDLGYNDESLIVLNDITGLGTHVESFKKRVVVRPPDHFSCNRQ